MPPAIHDFDLLNQQLGGAPPFHQFQLGERIHLVRQFQFNDATSLLQRSPRQVGLQSRRVPSRSHLYFAPFFPYPPSTRHTLPFFRINLRPRCILENGVQSLGKQTQRCQDHHLREMDSSLLIFAPRRDAFDSSALIIPPERFFQHENFRALLPLIRFPPRRSCWQVHRSGSAKNTCDRSGFSCWPSAGRRSALFPPYSIASLFSSNWLARYSAFRVNIFRTSWEYLLIPSRAM